MVAQKEEKLSSIKIDNVSYTQDNLVNLGEGRLLQMYHGFVSKKNDATGVALITFGGNVLAGFCKPELFWAALITIPAAVFNAVQATEYKKNQKATEQALAQIQQNFDEDSEQDKENLVMNYSSEKLKFNQ